MATNLNIALIIRAVDRATAPMRKVTRNFEAMHLATTKAHRSFERAAQMRQAAEGVNTFARATRGIVATPISEFEEFQQAMSRVASLGQSTPAELAAVRQQALLLGRTTEYTATAAARAAGDLSMMGFTKPKILEIMPSMLDLATASEMDLSQASVIASATLRAFQLEASSAQMARVADVLTTGFTGSAVSLSTLGESMKYAAPIAQQFHMSLEEITPLVGMLGNVGISGSEAGTALRAMMLRIAAPVRMSGKALKSLGVDAYETVNGVRKMRNVLDILADIRSNAMARPEDQRNLLLAILFGQEALGPVMALLNRFSGEEMLELQRSMTNAGGATKQTADIMRSNGKTATAILESAFTGLNISIGEQLEPQLQGLKVMLTNTFDALTNFADAHPRATKYIFGTTGAVAILSTVLASAMFTLATFGTLVGFTSYGIGGFRTGLQLLGATLQWVALRMEAAAATTLVLDSEVLPAKRGIIGYSKAIIVNAIPATKAWAFAIWTRLTTSLTAFYTMIWTRAIPAAIAWTGKMWASAAAGFAAAAPILAVAAAIGAVTLAIVQLVKHWDELDFAEGMRGIADSISESGILNTMWELIDPRTLLRDMGVMGPENVQRAVSAGTAGQRSVKAGAGASVPQNGRVDVGIKVDSEGRPRVTSIQQTGIANAEVESAYTGYALGGAL